MLSLQDREWEAFPLSTIFAIKSGKRLTKGDMEKGIRPFIGATENYNGVTNWVSNNNGSLDSNVLGVNYNGSVAESFYHPYECIFSDDVKRFQLRNRKGNRWVYLFLKTAIAQQKSKYAYGYKFNEQRMNKQSIVLPVNSDSKPDWAFMERYVREREDALLAKYKRHILDKCALSADEAPLPLENLDWQEFSVADYFDISTGTENNMDALRPGGTPLVSAKKMENGFKAFVKAKQVEAGHAITWNKDGDGGAGLAYYQPFGFAADSHILVLRPRQKLSSYACIFVTRALSQYYGIFGHGRANSIKRASKTKILLPAAVNGGPDWSYMERYSKAKKTWQIYTYLNYLKERPDM